MDRAMISSSPPSSHNMMKKPRIRRITYCYFPGEGIKHMALVEYSDGTQEKLYFNKKAGWTPVPKSARVHL